MGDVLGGTCSGSIIGSLYWGTGRAIDFLTLPVQEAESAGKKCFPLFCLPLAVNRLQYFRVVQQLDPAINICFALGLEQVELLAQGIGGQHALR